MMKFEDPLVMSAATLPITSAIQQLHLFLWQLRNSNYTTSHHESVILFEQNSSDETRRQILDGWKTHIDFLAKPIIHLMRDGGDGSIKFPINIEIQMILLIQ